MPWCVNMNFSLIEKGISIGGIVGIFLLAIILFLIILFNRLIFKYIGLLGLKIYSILKKMIKRKKTDDGSVS